MAPRCPVKYTSEASLRAVPISDLRAGGQVDAAPGAPGASPRWMPASARCCSWARDSAAVELELDGSQPHHTQSPIAPTHLEERRRPTLGSVGLDRTRVERLGASSRCRSLPSAPLRRSGFETSCYARCVARRGRLTRARVELWLLKAAGRRWRDIGAPHSVRYATTLGSNTSARASSREGKPKKLALVAAMRTLLSAMLSVARSGKRFEPRLPEAAISLE